MGSGPHQLSLTDQQLNRLREVARKVFEERFANQPQPQATFGKAIGGMSQAQVSEFLNGHAGISVPRAESLAQLAGFDLRDIVGEYGLALAQQFTRYPSLGVCIAYWGPSHWPDWTVSAARSGFFGPEDVSPSEWQERLDRLTDYLNKFPRHNHG